MKQNLSLLPLVSSNQQKLPKMQWAASLGSENPVLVWSFNQQLLIEHLLHTRHCSRETAVLVVLIVGSELGDKNLGKLKSKSIADGEK